MTQENGSNKINTPNIDWGKVPQSPIVTDTNQQKYRRKQLIIFAACILLGAAVNTFGWKMVLDDTAAQKRAIGTYTPQEVEQFDAAGKEIYNRINQEYNEARSFKGWLTVIPKFLHLR